MILLYDYSDDPNSVQNGQLSQLLIINKLPNLVNMNKQVPSKSLAHSNVNNNPYIPNGTPYNPQSFYSIRPNTHYTQYSPEKMSHSFIAPSISRTSFDLRMGNAPKGREVEQATVGSYSRLDSKENVRIHNMMGSENAEAQYKVIENRMRQIESRIQRIQKGQRKGDLIARNVEQMMRLQMRDIKSNQQLQDRMAILEDMITHVKNTKIDRNQHQNAEFLSRKFCEEQFHQLHRKEEANKEQIRDTRERLHRLVGKIESTIVAVSQKYEEFIERNIIKSIDQVNKLAHHYHQEIQIFKQQQLRIKQRIQSFMEKQVNPSKMLKIDTQLIGKALPNLKITQSISLLDQRKQKQFSQQFKIAKQSPKMMQFKGSLLNSMYDSIQNTQSSSTESLHQRITYKLDREFYLLDEYEHYILDSCDNKIRLSSQHIALLQNNHLIQ